MPMRSWLFVPGDSERKLAKAPGLGADVLIVDLEDAVAHSAKPAARALAAAWLAGDGRGSWVRINPLSGPLWEDDLAAVMAGAPAGIMVPKASGPEELLALDAALGAHERRLGLAPGSTQILPLVSETPAAALSLAAYAAPGAGSQRLAGLTWGAEDLSVALGATRKRDAAGGWTDAFRMVRATVLLTAAARGVAAIDTLHAEFSDLAGLQRIAADAAADGFAGMLAIHPAQVPLINAAFTPDAAEIARAKAIIAAFEAQPGAGALSFEGAMIDLPHLALARRLVARAADGP